LGLSSSACAATVRGSLPCAELLLRSGARLEQVDCRGYGAIHVAAQYGHTGMIYHFKMRWDADVDTHDNDGRSPLHWAAYKGFPDAVKLLLYMDAHISRPDKEGCTPLHWWGCTYKLTPAVERLRDGAAGNGCGAMRASWERCVLRAATFS
jgi:hypothetical protein